MPRIDPKIVVHEIKTYSDVKPIRKILCPIHPQKATAIKAEVENLLRAGFIYPIPLIDWVSNIVPIIKKQGNIRVCVDYRDINKACPKDNYPTPYIDQIIDDCARNEMFSFWMDFLDIITSTCSLLINQKQILYVLGGHFLIANHLRIKKYWCNFSKGYVLCFS